MLSTNDWECLQSDGGTTDLSNSVKLRLHGPDALRYLNGQVTNDVRKLAVGNSLAACLCTHKGRLEAFVIISLDDTGAYRLIADPAVRDFLPLRMEKYLIADDASIEDVTDQFDLVHTFGSAALPAGLTASASFAATRFGLPGTDHWLPAGSAACLTVLGTETLEALRIDRGIPGWESEMASGILPPEARLDEAAIDYHKGCYTGQEVISRIRSAGHVNRKLERLLIPGGHAAEPGWPIFSRNDDGTTVPAGTITSAAWHPTRQTGIALGFIKRGAPLTGLLTGPADGQCFTPVEIRKSLDDQGP